MPMAIHPASELTKFDKIKINFAHPNIPKEEHIFAMIGWVHYYGEREGLTLEKVNSIILEMMSLDLKHFIEVFDECFGKYFDIYV
jgi:hypothetical protein